MSHTVVIVGRPNVGKSSLYNRLTESEDAIVDPTSGVTRDRKYGIGEWSGKSFVVVDTGGISTEGDDSFEEEINFQVSVAIREADTVLFIVDGKEGLTSADEDIAKRLRRVNVRVMVVCNKVDTSDKESWINDFYSFGLGDKIYPISAANGYGTGDLMEDLVALVPEEPENDDQLTRVAIVGRPNVGKSSLLNILTDSKRSIVSETAGTTRDSVDMIYKGFGKEIILVDTAGLRRGKDYADDIEFYGSIRTIKAIRTSDVCLLLIDAEEALTRGDLAIFREITEANKGVVLLVNKWDLVEKDHKSVDRYTKALKEKLMPFSDVPIFFTSNVTRQRILKALERAVIVAENRKRKIATSQLNEIMLPLIENNPPPVFKGKDIKIKFITQLPTKSPAIAFFCNTPQYVKEPYQRFLENKLRENWDFSGIPVRLYFRQK
ncbi:MAG: ribosome biogenesis GTPase Der [Flavobacteriales bacterium]